MIIACFDAAIYDVLFYTEISTVEFGKISDHVRGLVEQHSSLVEQLNSAQPHHSDDVERNNLYRQLASLEPVVNLANQLKRKEKVCEHFCLS